jgi:hypothetical protein
MSELPFAAVSGSAAADAPSLHALPTASRDELSA